MEITATEAIKAVRGVPGDKSKPPSGGFVTVIAARLGCSRMQVYRLLKKYPTVAEALEDERERQKDFAEGKLQSLINKENPTAIIFYLKTQAKERGYVERTELDDMGGITLRVVYEDGNESNDNA